MKLYTVEDFTKLIQFINCRGFEAFFRMYKDAGFTFQSYALEKYKLATENFMYWWGELDNENREMFVNYAVKYYANK